MSSKKSTSTSTQDQTSHSVATPNVPDWIAQPAQTMAGNITGILGQGPAAFTPGISDLQKQAFTSGSNLTSSPYFQQAGDALGNVPQVGARDVTGQSLLTNLDQYYNPFKDQVLNPVLNDYDFSAGQTRAAQAANAAKNQAFQGSRYGLREAATEDALARGRATTEGGLLNQMFDTSTSLSGQDAARRQQADLANQQADLASSTANASNALTRGQLLAGLGVSSGADARANTALQGDLGAAQTTLENQQKQYPLTYGAQTEALLQGLNPALFTGQTTDSTGHSTGTQTTKETPGLLDYLGTAAQIGSLFAGVGGAGAGGTGGLGALFGSGPSSLSTKFGNFMNNDPTGMWRLGQAGG